MGSLLCVIVVAGALDERFSDAFEDLVVRVEDGDTQLTGTVQDQSELQGVLHRLFDLGLEIVSISTTADLPDPGHVAG